MTISERQNIYYERTLPVEFETWISTRYRIRLTKNVYGIIGGQLYHILIANLTEQSVKLQGVDLPIYYVKGRYEFTLSKRLKKLFKLKDRVRVKILAPSDEYYSSSDMLEQEAFLLSNQFLTMVYLHRVEGINGVIISRRELKGELLFLSCVKETVEWLRSKNKDKRRYPREIQTQTYEDQSTDYAVIRYFSSFKCFNPFKSGAEEKSDSYYISYEEKTVVHYCLMIITTQQLYKMILVNNIEHKIFQFLEGKTLNQIKSELVDFEERLEEEMIETVNNHLLKGEKIDNCLSLENFFHLSNLPSYRVLETILSLVDSGEVTTIEEISIQLKEKYSIDDPFYLNSSIAYLLARGIIKRVRVNGKNCLSPVRPFEKKK